MSVKVQTVENAHWVHYVDENIGQEPMKDPHKVGKWMSFWNDRAFAEDTCRRAIESGAVSQAKHSNADSGVSCFYLSVDDMAGHRRAIEFFLANEMIPRTKAGLLYNWSFKLDDQTRAGEYAGTGFAATLKLSELVDLRTGAWLDA